MPHEAQSATQPKRYRFGIWFFSALLTLLLIWLGSFALDDIGGINPPEISDAALLTQQRTLTEERYRLEKAVEAARRRYDRLKQSTESSQTTLAQLLDLEKVIQERGDKLEPEQQNAFEEAMRIFLDNDRNLQALLGEIAEIEGQQESNKEALNPVNREVEHQRYEVRRRHNILLATYKFIFLAPFVLLGAGFFAKSRRSRFAPLVHAFNTAVLILLIMVIHEHFPTEYFKYMFLAVAIGVVLAALVFLIRQLTRPGKRWLIERYKEAYRAAQCPVCAYPIVGDNMRGVIPDKKLARKKGTLEIQGTTQPYCCPSCGTRLFHECGACHDLRHSLLPHCLHCGASGEEGADAPA